MPGEKRPPACQILKRARFPTSKNNPALRNTQPRRRERKSLTERKLAAIFVHHHHRGRGDVETVGEAVDRNLGNTVHGRQQGVVESFAFAAQNNRRPSMEFKFEQALGLAGLLQTDQLKPVLPESIDEESGELIRQFEERQTISPRDELRW